MTFAGKLLTCCAAGAVLVACGSEKKAAGGRDIAYTGSTASIVISQANVATTASFAADSVSGSVGSAVGSPAYVGAASPGGRIGYETALAMVRAARQDAGAAFTGAYGTARNACAGGGAVTLTVSTKLDTASSNGDFMMLSFEACNDGQGTTAWGTIKVTITSTDGQDPSLGTSAMTLDFPYGMSLEVTDLCFETPTGWFGLDGNVSFTQTWTSTWRLESAIHGTSLVSAEGVGSTVTAASAIKPIVSGEYAMSEVKVYGDASATTLVETQSGITAKVCNLQMNGCINVETAQSIVQAANETYPRSGSLKVSDDLGHYIQVEPTNGVTGAVTVRWEIVLGAPTPDGTCYTTWATMSTDTCFQQ